MVLFVLSHDSALVHELEAAVGNSVKIRMVLTTQVLFALLARTNNMVLILDTALFADGAAVCRQLRAATNTLMLVIAAGSAVTERVLLLRAGADDVISRPYDVPELTARVRAMLRRVAQG